MLNIVKLHNVPAELGKLYTTWLFEATCWASIYLNFYLIYKIPHISRLTFYFLISYLSLETSEPNVMIVAIGFLGLLTFIERDEA